MIGYPSKGFKLGYNLVLLISISKLNYYMALTYASFAVVAQRLTVLTQTCVLIVEDSALVRATVFTGARVLSCGNVGRSSMRGCMRVCMHVCMRGCMRGCVCQCETHAVIMCVWVYPCVSVYYVFMCMYICEYIYMYLYISVCI